MKSNIAVLGLAILGVAACTSGSGGLVNNPATTAPTVALSANPTTVASGGSSILSWSSSNTSTCTASGAWSGTKATSGSQLFSNLSATGTYTLACTNTTGASASQSVTVTVSSGSNPPPSVTLNASSTTVASGGSSILSWSASNATGCTASSNPSTSGWNGAKSTSGSQTLSNLTTTATYTLTCTGAGGNASQTTTITVTTAPPPPVGASGSNLAQTAAAMQPGEWRELATDNLLPTLTQSTCPATGSIFPYAEEARWDPRSRRVYFLGSDHLHCSTMGQRFVAYSEDSNAWSVLPNPSWFGNYTAHAYDHAAIDTTNGIYYYFPFGGGNSRGLHRYDTSTNSWLTDTPNAPYTDCCAGVEYFPEYVGTNTSVAAGGVVLAGGGNVYVYRAATNSWSAGLSATRLNFGDYHTVAEYSPVHQVMIFGGGEIYNPYQAFNTLYKLAPNGTITALSQAPFNLRVNQSIVTVDPVGGDFLFFGPNGEFYALNPVTNTWTQQPGPPPFASPKRESGVTTVDLTVAAPISTYGVVMFVKHIPGNASETKVYLYKHKALVGGVAMPSAADEKATYQKWGWTWNASAEPAAVTEPIANYTVTNPDIHGDTEGDDLWSYLMMYRRTGNSVYLNRAQAWANYFKNGYRTNTGTSYTLDYDGSNFDYDHLYGWGLVAWYEHTRLNGNPDHAALAEAEQLGAIVESYWYQLNGNGTPRFVPGTTRIVNWQMRQPARHLLLAVRLAEATKSQRWIALRDRLLDLWLQSPDWTWIDAGQTIGMYYVGPWNTNEAIAPGTNCKYNDVAGCPYHDGARIVSPFQLGILTEAFDQAYRTTGRAELRNRMVAMARYVMAYGLDPTYQYTGSTFGIVNGQIWHSYSASGPTSWWDPVYTTSLVNTLVRGYKYTGDRSFYDKAKHYFNRGSKGVYGSTTQRAAGDTVAHHFVDTRFATADGNFYLDYNRGELQYTYLLFENGGLAP